LKIITRSRCSVKKANYVFEANRARDPKGGAHSRAMVKMTVEKIDFQSKRGGKNETQIDPP